MNFIPKEKHPRNRCISWTQFDINNKAIACIHVYKAAVYLHFACLYESVDVLHSYSLVQRFTVAKTFTRYYSSKN